jgi:lysozyme
MTSKARLAAKVGAGAAALALAFVAAKEGYVPKVYRDPIGRLAACYGRDDQSMKLGTTFTREQCVAMLDEDLADHAEAVDCFKVPLTDAQKVAIVSFAFNVGAPAVCRSTMVRKANEGAPPSEWCAELSRWVIADGKRLPGLVARRAEERRMCES